MPICTIDGGTYWEPVSDGFFKTGPAPSRWPTPFLPPKGLHQKLATLTNVIGTADGAPTRWTYAVAEELSARLAEHVEQLNALVVDSDLTAFLK